MKLGEAELFNYPVPQEDFPEYYELIDKPISFSEIKERLDGRGVGAEGASAYQGFGALIDIDLVYENCRTFNADGSDIVEVVDILQTMVIDTISQALPEFWGAYEAYKFNKDKKPKKGKDKAVVKEEVEVEVAVAAAAAPMTEAKLKAALKKCIIDSMKLEAAEAFNYPISQEYYPDYYKLIKKPMNFQTIRERIETDAYAGNLVECLSDIDLMWQNCIKYNSEGSDIVEVTMQECKAETERLLSERVPQLWAERPSAKADRKRTRDRDQANSKFLMQIVRDAKQLSYCEYFLYPVDVSQFPGYSEIVQQPMDLTTIEKSIKAGAYNSAGHDSKPGRGVDAFAIDMDLIWENCLAYNDPNSDIGDMANAFCAWIDENLKSAQYQSLGLGDSRGSKCRPYPNGYENETLLSDEEEGAEMEIESCDNEDDDDEEDSLHEEKGPAKGKVDKKITPTKSENKKSSPARSAEVAKKVPVGRGEQRAAKAVPPVPRPEIIKKVQLVGKKQAPKTGDTAELVVERTRKKDLNTHDHLEKILKKLMNDARADAFLQTVDAMRYPDYYDIISDPMCMSVVCDNLNSGHYDENPANFLADMRLIFNNAMKYFAPSSDEYKYAAALMEGLNRKYQYRFVISSNSEHSSSSSTAIKRERPITSAAPISGYAGRPAASDQAMQAGTTSAASAGASAGYRPVMGSAPPPMQYGKVATNTLFVSIPKLDLTKDFKDHEVPDFVASLKDPKNGPRNPYVRAICIEQARVLIRESKAPCRVGPYTVLKWGSIPITYAHGEKVDAFAFHNTDFLFPTDFAVKRSIPIQLRRVSKATLQQDHLQILDAGDTHLPLEITSRIATHQETIKGEDGAKDTYKLSPRFQVQIGEFLLADSLTPKRAWTDALLQASTLIHFLSSKLRRCRAVLNRVCVAEGVEHWITKVPETTTEGIAYYKENKSPMWLEEVHRRLNTGAYRDEFDFAFDMRLCLGSNVHIPGFASDRDAYKNQGTLNFQERKRVLFSLFENLFGAWIIGVVDQGLGSVTPGEWDRWQTLKRLDGPSVTGSQVKAVTLCPKGEDEQELVCESCGDVFIDREEESTISSGAMVVSVGGDDEGSKKSKKAKHDIAIHHAAPNGSRVTCLRCRPISFDVTCSRLQAYSVIEGDCRTAEFDEAGCYAQSVTLSPDNGPGWYVHKFTKRKHYIIHTSQFGNTIGCNTKSQKLDPKERDRINGLEKAYFDKLVLRRGEDIAANKSFKGPLPPHLITALPSRWTKERMDDAVPRYRTPGWAGPSAFHGVAMMEGDYQLAWGVPATQSEIRAWRAEDETWSASAADQDVSPSQQSDSDDEEDEGSGATEVALLRLNMLPCTGLFGLDLKAIRKYVEGVVGVEAAEFYLFDNAEKVCQRLISEKDGSKGTSDKTISISNANDRIACAITRERFAFERERSALLGGRLLGRCMQDGDGDADADGASGGSDQLAVMDVEGDGEKSGAADGSQTVAQAQAQPVTNPDQQLEEDGFIPMVFPGLSNLEVEEALALWEFLSSIQAISQQGNDPVIGFDDLVGALMKSPGGMPSASQVAFDEICCSLTHTIVSDAKTIPTASTGAVQPHNEMNLQHVFRLNPINILTWPSVAAKFVRITLENEFMKEFRLNLQGNSHFSHYNYQRVEELMIMNDETVDQTRARDLCALLCVHPSAQHLWIVVEDECVRRRQGLDYTQQAQQIVDPDGMQLKTIHKKCCTEGFNSPAEVLVELEIMFAFVRKCFSRATPAGQAALQLEQWAKGYVYRAQQRGEEWAPAAPGHTDTSTTTHPSYSQSAIGNMVKRAVVVDLNHPEKEGAPSAVVGKEQRPYFDPNVQSPVYFGLAPKLIKPKCERVVLEMEEVLSLLHGTETHDLTTTQRFLMLRVLIRTVTVSSEYIQFSRKACPRVASSLPGLGIHALEADGKEADFIGDVPVAPADQYEYEYRDYDIVAEGINYEARCLMSGMPQKFVDTKTTSMKWVAMEEDFHLKTFNKDSGFYTPFHNALPGPKPILALENVFLRVCAANEVAIINDREYRCAVEYAVHALGKSESQIAKDPMPTNIQGDWLPAMRTEPLGFDAAGNEFWAMAANSHCTMTSILAKKSSSTQRFDPCVIVRRRDGRWFRHIGTNLLEFCARLRKDIPIERLLHDRMALQVHERRARASRHVLRMRNARYEWLKRGRRVSEWLSELLKSVSDCQDLVTTQGMTPSAACNTIEIAFARAQEVRLMAQYASVTKNEILDGDVYDVSTMGIKERDIIAKKKRFRDTVYDEAQDLHVFRGWLRRDNFTRVREIGAMTTGSRILADPNAFFALQSNYRRSRHRMSTTSHGSFAAPLDNILESEDEFSEDDDVDDEGEDEDEDEKKVKTKDWDDGDCDWAFGWQVGIDLDALVLEEEKLETEHADRKGKSSDDDEIERAKDRISAYSDRAKPHDLATGTQEGYGTARPTFVENYSLKQTSNATKAIVQMDINTLKPLAWYGSGKEAASSMQVSQSGISLCCSGTKDDCYGFKWRFASDREVEPFPDQLSTEELLKIRQLSSLSTKRMFGAPGAPVEKEIPEKRVTRGKVNPLPKSAFAGSESDSEEFNPDDDDSTQRNKKKQKLAQSKAVGLVSGHMNGSGYNPNPQLASVPAGIATNGANVAGAVAGAVAVVGGDATDVKPTTAPAPALAPVVIKRGPDHNMHVTAQKRLIIKDQRAREEDPHAIPCDMASSHVLVNYRLIKLKSELLAITAALRPRFLRWHLASGIGYDSSLTDSEEDNAKRLRQQRRSKGKPSEVDARVFRRRILHKSFVRMVNEASTPQQLIDLCSSFVQALPVNSLQPQIGNKSELHMSTTATTSADVALFLYSLDRSMRWENLPIDFMYLGASYKPRTHLSPRCTVSLKCCCILGHSGRCLDIFTDELDEYSRVPEKMDSIDVDARAAEAARKAPKRIETAPKEKRNRSNRRGGDSESDLSESDSEDEFELEKNERAPHEQYPWLVNVDSINPYLPRREQFVNFYEL